MSEVSDATAPTGAAPSENSSGSAGQNDDPPGLGPLWSALRDVRDPELPISVVDLGLVYGIRRVGPAVQIDLTFTATACPCMDFIKEDVRDRLLGLPDVESVDINVVWDPPWSVERISAEGREILRRYGVAA